MNFELRDSNTNIVRAFLSVQVEMLANGLSDVIAVLDEKRQSGTGPDELTINRLRGLFNDTANVAQQLASESVIEQPHARRIMDLREQWDYKTFDLKGNVDGAPEPERDEQKAAPESPSAGSDVGSIPTASGQAGADKGEAAPKGLDAVQGQQQSSSRAPLGLDPAKPEASKTAVKPAPFDYTRAARQYPVLYVSRDDLLSIGKGDTSSEAVCQRIMAATDSEMRLIALRMGEYLNGMEGPVTLYEKDYWDKLAAIAEATLGIRFRDQGDSGGPNVSNITGVEQKGADENPRPSAASAADDLGANIRIRGHITLSDTAGCQAHSEEPSENADNDLVRPQLPDRA